VAVRSPAPTQRARPDGHRARGHRVPCLGRRPVRRRTTGAVDTAPESAALPSKPARPGSRLRVHGVPARRADVQALRGR